MTIQHCNSSNMFNLARVAAPLSQLATGMLKAEVSLELLLVTICSLTGTTLSRATLATHQHQQICQPTQMLVVGKAWHSIHTNSFVSTLWAADPQVQAML